jgi:hypothetical protein
MVRIHGVSTPLNPLPVIAARIRPGARRMAAAAAALGLASMLAACGSSPSATPPPPPPPAHDHATFHAEIRVDGAVLLKKLYTYTVARNSCRYAAAYGDAPGRVFRVPTPSADTGPQVHIQVAGFHGAGTYPPEKMRADKSDSISLTVKGVTSQYQITSDPVPAGQVTGKEVLDLYKNGGGYLVFAQAHQSGKQSNPEISGLINWSCTS